MMLNDVDEYGFKIEEEVAQKARHNYFAILTRRSIRWTDLMKNTNPMIRSKKLKRFIRKGIPLSLRREVWMKCSGAQRALETQPNLYQELLKRQFKAEIVEIIKIDLPRTFPDNIYFEEYKMRLFNILVAFAEQNQAVGYCQGLNYIAGLLLISTKDDKSSFWLLKHLVENIAPSYHSRKMEGLQRDIHVISTLVKQREPIVNEKINELGLPWAVIVSKWLICLYAEVLPVETTLRVWDLIFAEGDKIIFRVALGIINTLKDDIMKAEDITELNNLFRNMSTDSRFLDCHRFIASMFHIKLKRSQVDFIRNSYVK